MLTKSKSEVEIVKIYPARRTGEKYLAAISAQTRVRPYTIIISEGTVDNNLGQDHLAGPNALDPNNCRQPTL